MGITGSLQYDGAKQTLATSKNNWEMCFSTVVGTTYASAFAQKATTTTMPSTSVSIGSCVINPGEDNFLVVRPFAADGDGETFSVRVWGWSMLNLSGTTYWIPQLIATIACTNGTTATGLGSDTLWADTLAETVDMAPGSVGINLLQPSSADNTPAAFIVDYSGHQLVELEFTNNSLTAESMNGLWRTF